ncbi:hypothetical protein Q4Q34_08565 [Flavivirga abyssicola]|uniref:hypothetical protein n=1 Tax=Flavivirga abyssicola TaxID=3063533 RepID=UPI0026DFFBC1|nr:hypothetical protein [Flavivirga sp. MEBiC07777]WVK15079.1 hypothetical protein Q4Q34_08565 [Flavivirga sp. MEBiC07777]
MKKIFLISCLILMSSFIIQPLIAQNKSIGGMFNDDWSRITYKVDKQPVFDISNVKTVIISEVVNRQNIADSHSIDMYDELANNITSIKGLTLVDRSKTQSLLKEFDFQQSGLVNESQIKKLGEFYSSGLIVFVRIQTDNFSQSVKKVDGLFSSSPSWKRIGVYRLDVNFKIIDLKTASILFSQNLKSKIEKSGSLHDYRIPPQLDPIGFYQDAKEDIGIQFKELFILHQKEYEINFQTHRKFNSDLKKAITLLEIDDFEGGYAMIKSIPQKSLDDKAKSFALYNVAKMQLFNGEYEVSLKNAKEAYLLNPKNDECLEIINELK